MLDSIIRVRLSLQLKGICCTGLTVTPSMLNKFNITMYKKCNNVDDDENDADVVEELYVVDDLQ